MEKAAGQGHAYAMYELGSMYCVRKEYEEAVAWLTKGAEAGLPQAMYALGGIHDERNEHQQALEWNTKAAEAGLPDAMYDLARCLETGEGVAAKDYPAAAGWYRRASDAGFGDGEAAANLSDMYIVGRGVAWQIMPATSSATF